MIIEHIQKKMNGDEIQLLYLQNRNINIQQAFMIISFRWIKSIVEQNLIIPCTEQLNFIPV